MCEVVRRRGALRPLPGATSGTGATTALSWRSSWTRRLRTFDRHAGIIRAGSRRAAPIRAGFIGPTKPSMLTLSTVCHDRPIMAPRALALLKRVSTSFSVGGPSWSACLGTVKTARSAMIDSSRARWALSLRRVSSLPLFMPMTIHNVPKNKHHVVNMEATPFTSTMILLSGCSSLGWPCAYFRKPKLKAARSRSTTPSRTPR
mmetsp:Transcript_49241/g.145384  ORF Transcript_49241/g.145384 Transcript_49241/m.145384 type:complete len:203 (+) Transcript_49241:353-961(+)